MRRYCSIPEIGNLRKWFEKNFNQPCVYHDQLYGEAKVSRFAADIALVSYMLKAVEVKDLRSKVIVYWPMTFITFIAVRMFGWLSYGTE